MAELKLCKDIDTCWKIQILKDKDMLDFQFAESVQKVCAKCSDYRVSIRLEELEALSRAAWEKSIKGKRRMVMTDQAKKLREKLLEEIIQYDPRTSIKIFNRSLSQSEVTEQFKFESGIIKKHKKFANNLLSLITSDKEFMAEWAKENGWVELDKDQNLPELGRWCESNPICSMYYVAQQDMLKAGFRKVKVVK